MITVYYFARLKEVTGKEKETLSFDSITVRELIEWAGSAYDDFSTDNGSTYVAVNEEYAQLDDLIQSGDDVAFIPPVSGG